MVILGKGAAGAGIAVPVFYRVKGTGASSMSGRPPDAHGGFLPARRRGYNPENLLQETCGEKLVASGETMNSSELIGIVTSASRNPVYRDYFTDILLRLCAVDTTVGREPAAAARSEAECLGIAARELGLLLPPDAVIEKQPIDPRITGFEDFTVPPAPYTAREYYAGRYNLVARTGTGKDRGIPMIYNAHVDTVAPFFPPKIEGGRIRGRGTADDKGAVALLLTCLKLLCDLRSQYGVEIPAPRVYQFVIEEESGGNGTLSALLDESLRSYSALVLEITSLAVHPANRGAVWYQAHLRKASPEVRAAELAAEVVLALEEEGAEIKKESRHPLFLPHHVQTCHGILGPYGKHPSAVNDYVALTVERLSAEEAEKTVEKGVREYTERYGDKTGVTDPETGKPVVERHFSLRGEGPEKIILEIHGKAGHMGAIHKCDCALIKAAFVVRALLDRGARVELREGERDSTLLEGGQGFVPTHGINEIKERLTEAAQRGARRYAERVGLSEEEAGGLVEMEYEKLHNDAYAGRLESRIMQEIERSWSLAGRPWPEPKGWDVSCDARIFHHFGHDVVVWGPGELALAHSAEESISVDEAMEALPLLTLFTLCAGGAL